MKQDGVIAFLVITSPPDPKQPRLGGSRRCSGEAGRSGSGATEQKDFGRSAPDRQLSPRRSRFGVLVYR